MKDIEAEKNRATDTCKKAEALAHEIIEMCIGKGITLRKTKRKPLKRCSGL